MHRRRVFDRTGAPQIRRALQLVQSRIPPNGDSGAFAATAHLRSSLPDRFPLAARPKGRADRALAEKHGLPDWTAQQDVVQLYTTDGRTLFQLAVRDVYVSIENFEDLAEAIASAQNFMADAIDALKVDYISWTGTRMHWFAAADSFEELCDWFAARSGGIAGAVSARLDRKASDIGLVMEFKDKDPLLAIRLGPMRAEQAIAQFFRDQDLTRFPEQFLFLDVDRVHPNDRLKPAEALSQWKQRVDSLSTLGEALLRSVTKSQ
jgi:hypothetical protein